MKSFVVVPLFAVEERVNPHPVLFCFLSLLSRCIPAWSSALVRSPTKHEVHPFPPEATLETNGQHVIEFSYVCATMKYFLGCYNTTSVTKRSVRKAPVAIEVQHVVSSLTLFRTMVAVHGGSNASDVLHGNHINHVLLCVM